MKLHHLCNLVLLPRRCGFLTGPWMPELDIQFWPANFISQLDQLSCLGERDHIRSPTLPRKQRHPACFPCLADCFHIVEGLAHPPLLLFYVSSIFTWLSLEDPLSVVLMKFSQLPMCLSATTSSRSPSSRQYLALGSHWPIVPHGSINPHQHLLGGYPKLV